MYNNALALEQSPLRNVSLVACLKCRGGVTFLAFGRAGFAK